ncbi:MAG: DNA starvation/stationary phase protection protein [Bacteroidota bacterium]
MKPNIGLSEKNLSAVNGLLTAILSDAVVLYTKTRKFHWNVSGNSFMELHKLFEAHYKKLEEAIDEIAERINKLGSKTPGTMNGISKSCFTEGKPGQVPCTGRNDKRIAQRP